MLCLQSAPPNASEGYSFKFSLILAFIMSVCLERRYEPRKNSKTDQDAVCKIAVHTDVGTTRQM